MPYNVLMLMDAQTAVRLDSLKGVRGNIVLHQYPGLLADAADFLRQNGRKYDVVAVFAHEEYADMREAAEREYRGKRLLLQSADPAANLNRSAYSATVRIPALPGVFARTIDDMFEQ